MSVNRDNFDQAWKEATEPWSPGSASEDDRMIRVGLAQASAQMEIADAIRDLANALMIIARKP